MMDNNYRLDTTDTGKKPIVILGHLTPDEYFNASVVPIDKLSKRITSKESINLAKTLMKDTFIVTSSHAFSDSYIDYLATPKMSITKIDNKSYQFDVQYKIKVHMLDRGDIVYDTETKQWYTYYTYITSVVHGTLSCVYDGIMHELSNDSEIKSYSVYNCRGDGIIDNECVKMVKVNRDLLKSVNLQERNQATQIIYDILDSLSVGIIATDESVIQQQYWSTSNYFHFEQLTQAFEYIGYKMLN